MLRSHEIPTRLLPGMFFQMEDGRVWRIEAIDGNRWTVRRLEGAFLHSPRSVVANFECAILSTEAVRDKVLALLGERVLDTQRGSCEGEIRENDCTGAWSKDSSYVTCQERFARTFVAPPEWIAQILEMWGMYFVVQFFIRLETLGGYYDARWDQFTSSSEPEYHPSLAQRDFQTEMKDPRGTTDWIRGSMPDFERYHDTSDSAAIRPHLELIESQSALERIAAEARCPAVRQAAEAALKQRGGIQLDLFGAA